VRVEDCREARLRPEFAELYPVLPPDVWMTASDVGRQLLLWHLTTDGFPRGERLFSEDHFDFRGGERRSGSWVNQRSEQAPH
jgi:hypothetical protein